METVEHMKKRQTVFFTLPDKKLQIIIMKLNLVLKSPVRERNRSVTLFAAAAGQSLLSAFSISVT